MGKQYFLDELRRIKKLPLSNVKPLNLPSCCAIQEPMLRKDKEYAFNVAHINETDEEIILSPPKKTFPSTQEKTNKTDSVKSRWDFSGGKSAQSKNRNYQEDSASYKNSKRASKYSEQTAFGKTGAFFERSSENNNKHQEGNTNIQLSDLIRIRETDIDVDSLFGQTTVLDDIGSKAVTELDILASLGQNVQLITPPHNAVSLEKKPQTKNSSNNSRFSTWFNLAEEQNQMAVRVAAATAIAAAATVAAALIAIPRNPAVIPSNAGDFTSSVNPLPFVVGVYPGSNTCVDRASLQHFVATNLQNCTSNPSVSIFPQNGLSNDVLRPNRLGTTIMNVNASHVQIQQTRPTQHHHHPNMSTKFNDHQSVPTLVTPPLTPYISQTQPNFSRPASHIQHNQNTFIQMQHPVLQPQIPQHSHLPYSPIYSSPIQNNLICSNTSQPPQRPTSQQKFGLKLTPNGNSGSIGYDVSALSHWITNGRLAPVDNIPPPAKMMSLEDFEKTLNGS